MRDPGTGRGIGLRNLRTQVVGSRVFVYEEVGSTNDLAAQLGGDGTVVVAHRQTAGRGRHGRAWHSAAHLGLWFSVALAGRLHGLGFAAVLAVRDALESRCAVEVKWPNDLLVCGCKVCGILLEYRNGHSIAGIGLNVHQELDDFPPDLRGRAGSLQALCGGTWDRSELLHGILEQLDARVVALRSGRYSAVHEEWAEACGLIGRRIRHGGMEGTVADIDGLGALILETEAGTARLVSGEINVLQGV